VAGLSFLALFGLVQGWWRLGNPERFPVWGLDVSHHQGSIDWALVAKEPRISFAYLKASEGADWVDHRFHENWAAARRAGLKVGAYHFYTFCSTGRDQAKNFLSVIQPAPDALPPAVDLEFGGNCRRNIEAAELRRELSIWLNEVERSWSRRPVIYATAETYEAFLAGSDFHHPVWIRGLWREPHLPDGRPWTFWQFESRARLPGISGQVDLNAFQGSPELLDQLITQR
jgi:lysozyme